MDKGIGTTVITQIGIVVRDIDRVSQAYADFLGVPKPAWILTGTAEEAQTIYQGNRTDGRAKLAFFKCGQLEIELIEPDEHPSTWRDFLDRHGEGVHHIALGIQGMGEKVMLLEQKGFPLVQKGEFSGGRYAYLDSFKELKVMVELLEHDKD